MKTSVLKLPAQSIPILYKDILSRQFLVLLRLRRAGASFSTTYTNIPKHQLKYQRLQTVFSLQYSCIVWTTHKQLTDKKHVYVIKYASCDSRFSYSVATNVYFYVTSQEISHLHQQACQTEYNCLP